MNESMKAMNVSMNEWGGTMVYQSINKNKNRICQEEWYKKEGKDGQG